MWGLAVKAVEKGGGMMRQYMLTTMNVLVLITLPRAFLLIFPCFSHLINRTMAPCWIFFPWGLHWPAMGQA